MPNPSIESTLPGVRRILIPRHLNRCVLEKPSCKPLPGGINVQNAPHGPVYPAGFAG